MIKCGKCKGYHATVAAVKLCCDQPAEPVTLSMYGNGPVQSVSRAVFTEADEREMQRMEAEGDRAETEREEAAKWAHKERAEARAVDMTPAPEAQLRELIELLETKVAPEAEWRYVKAVRKMLADGQPSGYAVRTAIARISPWDNVRAGSGRASAAHAGHTPDEGRWSAADRERAQMARAFSSETGPSHEGLYKLSRDVRLFDGKVVPAGTLVQVLRGKGSQKLYANTVQFNGATTKAGHPKPDLCYVKGLIFKILDSELVPVEEAQELTKQTGWCIFGHFLTNPVSIARGMGDTCYSRYPHLARNAA